MAGGADLVVMLVHEGAPSTDCTTMDDSGKWAEIINTVSPDVDAIVSGHTHLAYNCSFPVAEWATDGRAVTDRPVVSAGQYGTNLNQLVYTVDGATGEVSAKTQALLPLEGPVVTNPNTVLYPSDPTVAANRQGRRRRRPDPRRCPAGTDRRRVRQGAGAERSGCAHREPRRRIDSGQPRRRGAAVGDRGAGIGRSADRVHEPGRSAWRHARRRSGRWFVPPRADLSSRPPSCSRSRTRS